MCFMATLVPLQLVTLVTRHCHAAEELLSTLAGFGVTAEDIQAVVAAHDVDHNGKLDFQVRVPRAGDAG